jgi:hypothetical protein
MTKEKMIHLGYEVSTGKPVSVPLLNLAVTGQTQQSGKTTALEALAVRSDATVITFVTKRGEGGFADGRRVRPYFRDRADWQFVDAIMEAALNEKNKFLRQFLIPICRTTRTLAEVQRAVKDGLRKAKGVREGALIQLDAYLDLIVPEIARARLAQTLDVRRGLNVMDVSEFSTPMQMLFVQSAIDWVNEHLRDTVVVIPEAWQFIPEGKGSPVKASAVSLVRKGSGIGNHIFVDSQDMAGVDKVILRGCPVWLIGVQREINEIKRNIANIPAPIGKPKPGDVAMLELGQFFVCFGKIMVKTYVQPSWMDADDAFQIASGVMRQDEVSAPKRISPKEEKVTQAEADALRADNRELREKVKQLEAKLSELADHNVILMKQIAPVRKIDTPQADRHVPLADEPSTFVGFDIDAIYAEVKRRALAETPVILKLLTERPEIKVEVKRNVLTINGATLKGRLARLLADGFFDAGATDSAARGELKRCGPDTNNANRWKALQDFVKDGFLTREGDRYQAVAAMKVSIVEIGV